MEHAALGHDAVRAFVPASRAPLLRAAMADHDRDFADFYNGLAALLEAPVPPHAGLAALLADT